MDYSDFTIKMQELAQVDWKLEGIKEKYMQNVIRDYPHMYCESYILPKPEILYFIIIDIVFTTKLKQTQFFKDSKIQRIKRDLAQEKMNQLRLQELKNEVDPDLKIEIRNLFQDLETFGDYQQEFIDLKNEEILQYIMPEK